MVDDFIKRKRDPSKVIYDPPQLEPILKETYGVIVYQEQVMAIANQLGGFSLGQADLLRRAMGKKKPEEMANQKDQFLAGARNNHIPEKKAGTLFDQMAYFGGYGFNKSHSAAYALITYQTAYLKTHHPTEFMAALLTTEMRNTDKMVGYLTECRDLGLQILPPDVNQSSKNFTVVEGGIRYGLAAIKNVGGGAVESILSTRIRDGAFSSFYDFCCRMELQKVNKRVLEGLIKVGAFDSMGSARSQLMAIADKTLEEANIVQRKKQLGQTSLFEIITDGDEVWPGGYNGPALPNIPEWPKDQLLKYERELTGFYITDHPLTRHATAIHRFATASTVGLTEIGEGKEVKLCGIVSSIKHLTTKKGGRMAYFQLEDLKGTVEVIVFPDLYRACSTLLQPESIIQVTGTVDHMDQGARIKCTKVDSLHEQAQTIQQVTLSLDESLVAPSRLLELEAVLKRYPGSATVSFTFHLPSDIAVQTSDLPNFAVLPNVDFLNEVEQILGKGTATLH
jgi:DNA polymerase-3 subunit alpha